MSLKSSTKITALAFAICSSHIFAQDTCDCKPVKKTDHVFSHKHYILMDYSLDSFDDIGDDRRPQFSMGSNLVYYTKKFSIFSDIIVGESSSTPRPILDGKEHEQEIKQIGVSVPFYFSDVKNRVYVGKLALPTGFYENQRIIPTVDNGYSLNDSFIGNYYTQYIPPSSNGVMWEIQYRDFIFTLGTFEPEELTTNFMVDVSALKPFLPLIPQGTQFPFFAGGANIAINPQGTNPFPQKVSLPVATQRYINYFSVMYDNMEDFIIKAEYLQNNPELYTEFGPVDPNDVIQTYNVITKNENQDYYRIGMEKRIEGNVYLKLEQYLETAKLYDEYRFSQKGNAFGVSKSFDDYTIHSSYVIWHESIIGQDEEFSIGTSYQVFDNLTSRIMYRKVKGSVADASVRSGTLDPQYKVIYDLLESTNPGFSKPKISNFEMQGFEVRFKYIF